MWTIALLSFASGRCGKVWSRSGRSAVLLAGCEVCRVGQADRSGKVAWLFKPQVSLLSGALLILQERTAWSRGSNLQMWFLWIYMQKERKFEQALEKCSCLARWSSFKHNWRDIWYWNICWMWQVSIQMQKQKTHEEACQKHPCWKRTCWKRT